MKEEAVKLFKFLGLESSPKHHEETDVIRLAIHNKRSEEMTAEYLLKNEIKLRMIFATDLEGNPVSEFNQFKPRLKSPKNRFQLSARLKNEKQSKVKPTIFEPRLKFKPQLKFFKLAST